MAADISYHPAYLILDASRKQGFVDDSIKNFVSTFYAVSDDPDKTDEWLEYFCQGKHDDGEQEDTATVGLNEKSATGIQEIRELRKGMWTHVQSRKHNPTRVEISVMDTERVEYKIYGNVRLVSRDDGTAKENEWYAYAQVVRVGNGSGGGGFGWRYKSYKVTLLPAN